MFALRVILCFGLSLALLPAAWADEDALEPGTTPPSFLGRDLRGNEISLEDLRGRVVLVSFWSSQCDPCLDDMPVLEHIQTQVEPAELRVVAVNMRDPQARTVRASLSGNKELKCAYTFDRRNLIANSYGIEVLPTMILVDKQGRIAHVQRGADEDRLEQIADRINRLLMEE